MSQKSKSVKRLTGLNDAELAVEEDDLRTAVWKLQLQRSTGQITDPSRLTTTRRELARLLTVRRQREMKAGR